MIAFAASNPHVDLFAISPEIALVGTIVVVLLADLVLPRRQTWQTSRIASIGVLVSLGLVAALALNEHNVRSLFGGAYVVDDYSLALKGFFLIATYITILLAVDYIAEGDYYQGEFYFLLLCSVLGMSAMTSARDLISLFVALETISIPTYVLAGYRKHDRRSNEAAIKYYLIGAISSAVMLYGMSLIYGVTGSTKLADIGASLVDKDSRLVVVAIVMSLIGFAFKVSAVPFHWWAPDTYEGAPTPVTAFLSVASKAGGFVAMLNIVFFGFATRPDAWWTFVWVIAIASMTLGNLTALKQTNIVRMLAYSSVAQGGFMLVPFAAYGILRDHGGSGVLLNNAFEAVVVYLLVYGAMNLGAFACIIAVARRTRSGEIESFAGLFQTSPALTVVMSAFLASLAGIPPLAGWFAKFVMFRSAIDAGGWAGVTIAIVAGVNSVIAAYYYLNIVRTMWFRAPAENSGPVQVPAALSASIVICTTIVVAVGVYPQWFAHLGDLAARVPLVSTDAIRELIGRDGSIDFATYMELALYGPDGFFTRGGGAGRSGGDFVTSPQTGALFGSLVAVAIEGEWEALGRPDPFVVVEAGAGDGRLARDVLRAAPEALRTALRYVLVERSPALRAAQRDRLAIEPPELALGGFTARRDDDPPESLRGIGPVCTQLDDLPALAVDGMVFANELLDNLPFGIVEFDGTQWCEVRVTLDAAGRLGELLVPCPIHRTCVDSLSDGQLTDASSAVRKTRVPDPVALGPWLRAAASAVRRGPIVLLDYAAPLAELAARSPRWLRVYAGHRRGADPYVAPGETDITADVAYEHLDAAAHTAGLVVAERVSQAEWLAGLGLAGRVDAARPVADTAVHDGGMESLRARSTINEAAALTDPDGLGGYAVWRLGRA